MLSDVIERIMKVLSHEDQILLSDGYLERLVNEGQRRLALYSDKTKTSKITLDAYTAEVDFPSDLLKVVRIYWGDDTEKRELRPAIGQLPLDSIYEIGTTWATETVYTEDELVLGTVTTEVYKCIADHTSSSDTRPSTGDDWEDAWELYLDKRGGSGDPIFFYLSSKTIFPRPLPGSGGHLYIVYTPSPAELVDLDDELEWEDSGDFLFKHSVYQFYADYGEEYERSAQRWKVLADEALFDWIYNSHNQNYSQPVVLRPNW